MSSDFIGGLAEQLRSREKKNLFRRRLALDGPQDVQVSIGGVMNISHFAAMIIWGLQIILNSSRRLVRARGDMESAQEPRIS